MNVEQCSCILVIFNCMNSGLEKGSTILNHAEWCLACLFLSQVGVNSQYLFIPHFPLGMNK